MMDCRSISKMKYDLIGQKFGYLTVVDEAEKDPVRQECRWRCVCECGKYTVVPSYRLRHGGVKSCGCHQHDRHFCSKKMINHVRLYRVYRNMLRRCSNSKSDNYHWYGEKGISVCEEWKTFDVFCDWALTNGYNENAPYGECTLDRIDINKGYSPDNCRWVDMRTQANNTSRNRMITAFGKTMTLAEWSRETGLKRNTIDRRLTVSGWTPERAVSTPSSRKRCLPSQGTGQKTN